MESLSDTLRKNANNVAYPTIAEFMADVETFAKAEFEELHHGRAYFDWDKAQEKLIAALRQMIEENPDSGITQNDLITLHENLNHSFYQNADAIHFSNASQVALRMAIKAHGECERIAHMHENRAANDTTSPNSAVA